MACDLEPGVALDGRRCIFQNATWETNYPSARIATHVVVMLITELVVRLSVREINPVDESFSLHACDCPEDAGVVGAANETPDRFVELVD